MFDLFKKKSSSEPDVKSIRDGLLQFIRVQLSKVQGGEGSAIKSLHLFLACNESETHLYDAAIYRDQEGRFKEDIQKIADDFAIELPPHWNLELSFTQNLPAEALKAPALPAALFIQTKETVIQKTATAYIKVLSGEAEKDVYTITSASGPINMGREKKVQTRDNFFRINTIAFPADSVQESNKYISRQHAHIEWDNATGSFLLFADEGGVPPRNKVKVRPQQGGDAVKLQSIKTGYSLQDGDQILLGETALLEFRFSPD
jgi:pSer/pThr/pTyr-binding forkhead associated (FHA) protein